MLKKNTITKPLVTTPTMAPTPSFRPHPSPCPRSPINRSTSPIWDSFYGGYSSELTPIYDKSTKMIQPLSVRCKQKIIEKDIELSLSNLGLNILGKVIDYNPRTNLFKLEFTRQIDSENNWIINQKPSNLSDKYFTKKYWVCLNDDNKIIITINLDTETYQLIN